MSIKQEELLDNQKVKAEEGASESANNLAVQYIIPVSVIVGVFLAAITIGCVCYRRWRFFVKIKKQHPADKSAKNGAAKNSGDQSADDDDDEDEEDDEEEAGKGSGKKKKKDGADGASEDDDDEEGSQKSTKRDAALTLATDEQLIGEKGWKEA